MDAPLTQPGRHDLPLQRPEPDHPRRPGRAGDGQDRSTRWSATASPRRWGCATPATTRVDREPDRRHGVPDRPGRAAWSGARCTTRTPGRSAGSPGTRGSSPPPTTWRCWPRRCSTAASTAASGSSAARASADLITNYNQDFPGDAHGLGFELDQRWYMDALSGPRTAGHTGYTGTSIVIDFASRSFAILLTNRVHPSATGGATTPPAGSGRGGWPWPWACGRGTARPPGSPVPATTPPPR